LTDIPNSTRILAAGEPVRFDDGTVVHVKFDTRALKMIEDTFGSLGHMQDVLPDTDHPDRPLIDPVSRIVAIGLHRATKPDGTAYTPDDIIDGCGDFQALAEAMGAALNQALPKAKAPEAPATPTNGTAVSPGLSSTSQPPSPLVAAMTSSGV
jgi:hypothetical protein